MCGGEQSEGQMTLGLCRRLGKAAGVETFVVGVRIIYCTSPWRAVPFYPASWPWLHLEPGRTVDAARVSTTGRAPTSSDETGFYSSRVGVRPLPETPWAHDNTHSLPVSILDEGTCSPSHPPHPPHPTPTPHTHPFPECAAEAGRRFWST